MRIASNRADKEWIAENLDKLKDEEDRYVEEQMNLLETPPTEEDDKAIWQSKFTSEHQPSPNTWAQCLQWIVEGLTCRAWVESIGSTPVSKY